MMTCQVDGELTHECPVVHAKTSLEMVLNGRWGRFVTKRAVD